MARSIIAALLAVSLLLAFGFAVGFANSGAQPRPVAVAASGELAGARADLSPTPYAAATLYVAQAAATFEAEQRAAAQTATKESLDVQAALAEAERAALLAAAQASQTAVAVAATAQRIRVVGATYTQEANWANLTATAIGPAATATQLAQIAKDEREAKSGWAWLVFWMVLIGVVTIILATGLRRWLISRGIEREKKAEGELAIAKAEAERIRLEAVRAATIVHVIPATDTRAGRMVTMLDGYVTQSIPLPPATPMLASPEFAPDAGTSDAQQAMIDFVKDAIKVAAARGKSNYIPTDADMGMSGSGWSSRVSTLKELGVVETRTGRPGTGKYGTQLVPRKATDLTDLLAKLERMDIRVAPTPS